MPGRRELSIPSGGQTLAATLLAATQPSGAGVLFVHGLGSDRGTNIDRAHAVVEQSGATCLAVDLCGHGDSTGQLSQMTPRQNLADVLAAYDCLAAQPGVQRSRIGVCAASYGGYLSVLASAHRPIARLLLRAPALYPDGQLDVRLGARQRADGASAAATIAVLGDLAAPTLVVESEHDDVIGRDVIRAYLGARPGIEHRILHGAGHALTDPAWRAEFEQMIVEFFAAL